MGALFLVSAIGAKTELPRGGGHAIRSRRRMFREGRPSSLRLHFGLHFGVVLGAKFTTILPLGRPGGQNRLAKEGRKKGTTRYTPRSPNVTHRSNQLIQKCLYFLYFLYCLYYNTNIQTIQTFLNYLI